MINKKKIYQNKLNSNNNNIILLASKFFNTNGMKKKFFKNVSHVMEFFFKKLLVNKILTQNSNNYEVIYNIKKNNKLRNVDFLIKELFKKAQIAFKITCVEVDKKYRKKLKKKYVYKLDYLYNLKRINFFLKNFYYFVNKNNERKILGKIQKLLIDSILNFNGSEFFKIKQLTFKHLSLKK